jgi:hypothetical protein
MMSSLATYAKIVHRSRKWQSLVVRETPARTRLFFPDSGIVVEGLLSPQANGCVVATLQAYYVYYGARTCPVDTYLARQWDGSFITADEVRQAIHVSREFGLSDKVVCIHSLKHRATSALAEAHMTDEEGRMAAGFKDATTLRIYDHPGIQLSDRLSRVLRIHGEEGEPDPMEEEKAISTSTGCCPVV